MMFVRILNSVVGREFDEVVGFEGDDVGEEIAALKSEVFDYEVECFVCVFDSWDWDVSDLEERRARWVSKWKEGVEREERRVTFSMICGRMTFRMSFHNSGLNLSAPSLSNKRSLVNLAQSSPNCLFN